MNHILRELVCVSWLTTCYCATTANLAYKHNNIEKLWLENRVFKLVYSLQHIQSTTNLRVWQIVLSDVSKYKMSHLLLDCSACNIGSIDFCTLTCVSPHLACARLCAGLYYRIYH